MVYHVRSGFVWLILVWSEQRRHTLFGWVKGRDNRQKKKIIKENPIKSTHIQATSAINMSWTTLSLLPLSRRNWSDFMTDALLSHAGHSTEIFPSLCRAKTFQQRSSEAMVSDNMKYFAEHPTQGSILRAWRKVKRRTATTEAAPCSKQPKTQ